MPDHEQMMTSEQRAERLGDLRLGVRTRLDPAHFDTDVI